MRHTCGNADEIARTQFAFLPAGDGGSANLVGLRGARLSTVPPVTSVQPPLTT